MSDDDIWKKVGLDKLTPIEKFGVVVAIMVAIILMIVGVTYLMNKSKKMNTTVRNYSRNLPPGHTDYYYH